MKRLAFADAHLRAQWIDGNVETIDAAVAARANLYEYGEILLSKMEFHVNDRNEPLLLHKKRELHFSRLAWARYCDALGVNRDFVRERLAQGEPGRQLLNEMLNKIVQHEKMGRRRTLYLYQTSHSTHTIREMMRDLDGTMPTEGELWEYLKKGEWCPTSSPPELIAARLTDYGHTFRYIVRPSTKAGEIAVLMDICASTVRKVFYAQGVLAIPSGGRVVPCRVDHQEIGGKTNCKQLSAMPDAVRMSLDATLDFAPVFAAKWKGRKWPEPGVAVFAAMRRTAINRKLLRDARRLLSKRLASASWNRPLTLEVALDCIVDAIRHDTDQPELANRMERMAHDLVLGEYVLLKSDTVKAAEHLKADSTIPNPKPRTWSAAQSGITS